MHRQFGSVPPRAPRRKAQSGSNGQSNTLPKMKVLLTGATGFIGHNLLAVLVGGDGLHSVCAVARKVPAGVPAGGIWIEADLGQPDWTNSLPDGEFDVIIHLAQSKHFREFPGRTLDIFNVKATVELAEWGLRHRVKRFMFASTGNVYGANDRIHIEDDRCEPDSMYAASKLSAEILLRPFSQFMDVAALRLFGVYGPGQANAMLPGIIQRFKAGDEIALAANVGVRFNPIYVDDCTSVIHGLITSSAWGGAQCLNVCGPEVVDLRQAVDILEREQGRAANVRVTAEHPKYLVGGTDKIEAICGRGARVPFKEGLIRTLRALQ